MAMTLYHGEPNGPSLSVLGALFETELEADLVHIDLARGERHGAGVPRDIEVEMSIEGEGPVLVADGEPMADSVFIGCYLDEMAGGGVLRPVDPYARWELMAWLRWITERTAPAAAFLGTRAVLAPVLAAMPEAEFGALTSSIASADLAERWAAVRTGDFPEDKAADSRAKIAQAVERCAAQLADGRDWLMGAFSLADLETYGWLAGMVETVPEAFEGRPQVAAWLERVGSRPSVRRALSLATIPEPRQSWAPGPEINRWG